MGMATLMKRGAAASGRSLRLQSAKLGCGTVKRDTARLVDGYSLP